jgi:hypothetical protein
MLHHLLAEAFTRLARGRVEIEKAFMERATHTAKNNISPCVSLVP